ncbi:MAG: malto-oligosyltrehalose synthase [Acidimicrobiales bacterium]
MIEPVATYRLQLTPEFGFAEAEALLGYLGDLGVSHLYLSPVSEAVPGSRHGYDVTDPGRLRGELGGEAAFRSLAAAAAAAGLGLLLDVVPNHVAADEQNPWWDEVLELGRAAPHAGHFDVDWDPPERRLRGQLALGVLDDHYGRVLSRGVLRLELADDRAVLAWPGGRLPLAPHTVGAAVEVAAASVGDDDLAFAGRALARCHGVGPTVAPDAAAASRLLARLLGERPACRQALLQVFDDLNADRHRLHAVLEGQHYELMRWQRSADDLVHRRFFDVSNLVGLRLEDPVVFDDVLGLPVRLHLEGLVDGFRLDHVDGLADPTAALRRLAQQAPDAWILVEKILTVDERLHDGWPVAGTTGYDAMARITALQADPAGVEQLESAWRKVTSAAHTLEEEELAGRRLVLSTSLHAEVARLTGLLVRTCEVTPDFRDFTRRELQAALLAAATAAPAYRSYGRAAGAEVEVTATDVDFVDRCLTRAATFDSAVDPDLWGFLRSVLLFEVAGPGHELAVRFQQLCGPVAAKGDEDTLSYRWTAFAGAAEVGHPLGRPAIDGPGFHDWAVHAQAMWPRALVALTTHDTKRSEDVRARLAVLSQEPAAFLGFWDHVAERHGTGPDPALAWLLAQVALAAHPISADRLEAYAIKAAREAKTVTTWIEPDEAAEASLGALARALATDPVTQAAVASLHEVLGDAFSAQTLVQKALGLTLPGVPDIYQGAELVDLRLVDPDNRTAVDFDERRRRLAEGWDPKLALVQAILALRRRQPESFGPGLRGAYVPYPTSSPDVVAFGRGTDVVVVAPRFAYSHLAGATAASTVDLPHGTWREIVAGVEVEGGNGRPLTEALAGRPVAILERT